LIAANGAVAEGRGHLSFGPEDRMTLMKSPRGVPSTFT